MIEANSERWFDLKDLPNEIWKPIKGYEGLYDISNMGRVKSLSRTIYNEGNYAKQFKSKEKILKSVDDGNGYMKVFLYNDGHRKHYKVHRLVAEAFILNPKNKPEINHIDGNKMNNVYSNLEWCDRSYNVKHAWDTGLKIKKTGSQNHRSRKVNQYDLEGNLIKCYDSIKQAQTENNKKKSIHIIGVCRKRRKTAGGYIWRYADE